MNNRNFSESLRYLELKYTSSFKSFKLDGKTELPLLNFRPEKLILENSHYSLLTGFSICGVVIPLKLTTSPESSRPEWEIENSKMIEAGQYGSISVSFKGSTSIPFIIGTQLELKTG